MRLALRPEARAHLPESHALEVTHHVASAQYFYTSSARARGRGGSPRHVNRKLRAVRPTKVVKAGGRALLRRYSPRLLHPQPASSLQPERLYLYLDALWQRRNLDGAIVEVGCWLAGTSAIASKMLIRTGYPHRYVAIDTFEGFVAEQFAHDEKLGTPPDDRSMFDANSLEMVRRLLDHWGASEVELLKADIASLAADRLPRQIIVCLIDVDLEIPVYEALSRIVPRLVPGGIVLVDDCPDETSWPGARAGYSRFMAEMGREEHYLLGMGLLNV
jgi:O-methyltransferase